MIQAADGIFVIFGITGDLAKRKLLPALYNLAEMNLLAPNFSIVGTSRRNTTTEDVIEAIRESRNDECDDEVIARMRTMLHMVHMNIGDPHDYHSLRSELSSIEAANGTQKHHLFYLAVPPEMFESVVNGLGNAGLNHGSCDQTESRLLIEKPFGYNTSSAIALIQQIEAVFPETAIYRVDHYLAKETAQNILTFRMTNPIFRAVWNQESIDHITITANEKIGIEGRANFYEKTGAMRDLIQSHLLQLLALVTMEEPASRSAQTIHAAKLALLKDIQPIAPEDVSKLAVRGQYRGYKEEVHNPQSTTETYAALRLTIENDRWRNVPILLQSGKAMRKKLTEITIVFKNRNQPSPDSNTLTINIQPNEGIELSLRAKKPSLSDETQTVHMEFDYSDSFTSSVQPDAYERVLIDAIRGDKTLFTTDEEVLTAWKIIENVLTAWQSSTEGIEEYEPGTWGPVSAQKLASDANINWSTP